MHPKQIAAAAPQGNYKASLLSLALLLMMVLVGVPAQTVRAAEPRVAVANSAAATPALRGAHLLGSLAPTQTLSVGLLLPLRNQAGLDTLLHRLYTRGDALYGKFLTPAQFTAQFGPTVQNYAAVAAYARSQGLKITGTHPGRTLLNVSGSVSAMETAFGIHLARYQLTDGRVVYANSAAPRLPQHIAGLLAGIAGLSNLSQMRPASQAFASGRADVPALTPVAGASTVGSGPNGGLAPNDIKYAYSLDTITNLYPGGPTGTTGTVVTGTGTTITPLDGTGQTVGLFELDGYDPNDIKMYVNQFSLLPVRVTATATSPLTVQNVLLNNFNGTPLALTGQREVTLDIDMVLALAPSLTNLYVYEENPATDTLAALTIFNRMTTDTGADGTPLLKVICCCWGLPELQVDPAIRTGENTDFQQMAAQGQSVFCASGNQGAYDDYSAANPVGYTLSVHDPASQPFATGVGGTSLKYNKPVAASTTVLIATPGKYVSESTWDTSGLTSLTGPVAGGGGISEIWAKPSYQTGLGSSPVNRDVPDVSLNADPKSGYDIYVAGNVETDGGTDAAAPLWAGFTSLVNQQRVLNGLGTLGFANTPLYAIANGTNYATEFHDVADGSTNLNYVAVTGYDDATGLGSFIGSALLADLAFNPDQGTSTATLSGSVTDTSGNAIINATITVTSTTTGAVKGTTVTDGSGNYSLTVPATLALNITVDPSTATASQLTTTTTNYSGDTIPNVTIAAGGSQVENFALAPAYVFPAGLQMISAPFDYTATGADFAALFGLTPPLRSPSARLIQWESDLNAYVFYPTSPADTLRPGQAYWVKFPAATYIRLGGTAVPITQAFQITLKQGWNQISDPFLSAAPLSGITADLPAGGSSAHIATSTLVQTPLYHYNMASGAYDALDATTGALQPYDGAWIYAKTTVVLSIPPESAPPPPTSPPGVPLSR